MNKYIYKLNIPINIEEIKRITRGDIYKVFDAAHQHHRQINNHPYLVELKNKYPIMGDTYNLYRLINRNDLEPHTDSDRNCAVNIPVSNTENSHTVFYSSTRTDNTQYHQRRIYDEFVPSELQEEFRFTLLEPTIINTKQIHGVINSGPDNRISVYRIIFSWSVLPQYSFEDAVEFFTQYPHGVV